MGHTKMPSTHTRMYQLLLLCALLILNVFYTYRQDIFEAWMRVSLRNEYIVVSMTTTPYRLQGMRPVVEFVLSENIPLKTLYLSIPHFFLRDNKEYVIPEWVKQTKGVTILRTQDYGPATKLLGALEQAKLPPKAIIITVDDDINYPKNYLLYLAYRAKREPDKAIGYSGMQVYYDQNGKVVDDSAVGGIGLLGVRKDKAHVPILEGFAAIAYRKKFFDEQIFNLDQYPRECRNSDDLYLSFYLAKNNIVRQVLQHKRMSLWSVTGNAAVHDDKDALHNLSPHPALRHRTCIEFMKTQHPGVKF